MHKMIWKDIPSKTYQLSLVQSRSLTVYSLHNEQRWSNCFPTTSPSTCKKPCSLAASRFSRLIIQTFQFWTGKVSSTGLHTVARLSSSTFASPISIHQEPWIDTLCLDSMDSNSAKKIFKRIHVQLWTSPLDVKFSPQLPGLWAPGSEKIVAISSTMESDHSFIHLRALLVDDYTVSSSLNLWIADWRTWNPAMGSIQTRTKIFNNYIPSYHTFEGSVSNLIQWLAHFPPWTRPLVHRRFRSPLGWGMYHHCHQGCERGSPRFRNS